MNQVHPTGLHRGLLTAAAGLALLGGADAAHAAVSEELLSTARNACLQQAANQGWLTDQAQTLSSRAIDADRVEVAFNLTRDGVNQARLTCPYSIRQGVLGSPAADQDPGVLPDASGSRTAESFIAEAKGSNGRVQIHGLADSSSLVRKDVPNGQQLSLTGRRSGEWLEVDGGGWVQERNLHQRKVNLATARPR